MSAQQRVPGGTGVSSPTGGCAATVMPTAHVLHARRSTMRLSRDQVDRARGAIIGSATGDALGAAYEFGLAPVGAEGPQMLGGGLGNFEPGEWTDDTAMAWCILDVAASGEDLRRDEALTSIATRFRAWYDSGPADIGNQTRVVLDGAGRLPTGATMTATSFDVHARTGHTAGNGSLMRTAPVAIRYLDDPAALVVAARRVSALTHFDRQAQDGCALWSLAIRHAVLVGEFDIRSGLDHIGGDAASLWADRLDAAESGEPSQFTPNGWVVTALQAAWSAAVHTPVPTDEPARHFADALTTAILTGDDTDTVAAIGGGLLGGRWGASAIRPDWRQMLHGYPGIRERDLIKLTDRTIGTKD
jgi:ADP-ribosyl-[dinitrogen reductase] hydrolase